MHWICANLRMLISFPLYVTLASPSIDTATSNGNCRTSILCFNIGNLNPYCSHHSDSVFLTYTFPLTFGGLHCKINLQVPKGLVPITVVLLLAKVGAWRLFHFLLRYSSTHLLNHSVLPNRSFANLASSSCPRCLSILKTYCLTVARRALSYSARSSTVKFSPPLYVNSITVGMPKVNNKTVTIYGFNCKLNMNRERKPRGLLHRAFHVWCSNEYIVTNSVNHVFNGLVWDLILVS